MAKSLNPLIAQRRNADPLQQLVGTAILDPEFRAALTRQPAAQAKKFGLPEDEVRALGIAPAASFDGLMRRLERVRTRRWTSLRDNALPPARVPERVAS